VVGQVAVDPVTPSSIFGEMLRLRMSSPLDLLDEGCIVGRRIIGDRHRAGERAIRAVNARA